MSDFWAKAKKDFGHLFPIANEKISAPQPTATVEYISGDSVTIHFADERYRRVLSLAYYWSKDFYLLSPCHGAFLLFKDKRFKCKACRVSLPVLTDVEFSRIDDDATVHHLLHEWLEITLNTLEASLMEASVYEWLKYFEIEGSTMRREHRMDHMGSHHNTDVEFNEAVAKHFSGGLDVDPEWLATHREGQ